MKEQTRFRSLISRWDLVLILTLAAAAVLMLLPRLVAQEDALHLVVERDGQVVYSEPLSGFLSPTVIRVEGTTLEITADVNGAAVTDSGCADHVCVRTGKLTHAGDAAVCLPQKVVVRLTGDAAFTVDAATG